MDADWRPTQASDPAVSAAGGDWRAELQAEARSRIVNKILETLRKHLQVSESEELDELQKIALRLEKEIYTAATDQSDYLRKISLKILSMETETQQAHGNAQVILNQNNPCQASADSTAQTGRAGAGDWQDEIYQMIKSLKDQYFAQLNELFNKISLKLQHVDSIIPRQMPSEQYERIKRFKIMLDRILQILQISKSTIQPALRDKVPQYEKQIISVLNSQRRKPVQAQVEQQLLQVQMNHYKASADSTAQTGYAGAGDWQEEIYQMIKRLKEQYFAELSELFNKISVKLQHVDSIIPRQMPSEQYERMKRFKIMLDRILQILQISKSTIQPALRDKVPQYEKQIISVLNSQRRKPVQAQVEQQLLQVQMNHYKASADSTAQTGYAGAGDWQEEIYQMIKRLKEQYFAELSELFNKISVKLQHVDSIITPQKPSEYYERMKSFKIMLDRMLQILQISKSVIQPALRDKIPQYEKQIISVLNSQRRKPVQPRAQQQFQTPAGQAPNFSISQQPSQSLKQHDSHTNLRASLSSMGTGLQSSSADFLRHVPAPPTTNFMVYTQQNGTDIQPQACFNMEAAQGSNFSSLQYGLMGGALREGSTWPMQGTPNAQLQTSMLSHNSVSTTQPDANYMQANERGWAHLSEPRKHAPKRSWRDAF